jgi:hypothetical protein
MGNSSKIRRDYIGFTARHNLPSQKETAGECPGGFRNFKRFAD